MLIVNHIWACLCVTVYSFASILQFLLIEWAIRKKCVLNWFLCKIWKKIYRKYYIWVEHWFISNYSRQRHHYLILLAIVSNLNVLIESACSFIALTDISRVYSKVFNLKTQNGLAQFVLVTMHLDKQRENWKLCCCRLYSRDVNYTHYNGK